MLVLMHSLSEALARSSKRGAELLHDPSLNKDAAFTLEERAKYGLEGLLPPIVQTLPEQVQAELEHISSKSDPLEKYIGLMALLDRNETLFYRLMIDHLDQLTPFIYTPVVGLACQRFSHIFRRPRGLYLTANDRGQILHRLKNWPHPDVRLIVVTDNERILGLGDQGAGGMGIPVGKLALYTAGAGIHPRHCMPVCLDVGTDNGALLEDPCYLGARHRRLRGEPYDTLVEEFVQAVRQHYPNAILQWEDFKKGNAFRLLERYDNTLASFNDDIQGTAAVTVAGVLAGLRLIGENWRSQRLLLVGAGAAGVGIARLTRLAMASAGLPESEIRQKILLYDSTGLVRAGTPRQDPHKVPFALTVEEMAGLGITNPEVTDLTTIAQAFKPTILIGTTAQPGIFSESLIRTMSASCKRPMIFPLSNPTSQAECTAKEAVTFSEGRALIGTGSPFAPVRFDGRDHVIGQSNNVFIFPGVGLGGLISHASKITESMFLAAADALAAYTVANSNASDVLYPRMGELRAISKAIAAQVAAVARDSGLGMQKSNEQIAQEIEQFSWDPSY